MAPIPFATSVLLLIVVSAIWLLATDLVLGIVAVSVFPLLMVLNVVYQKRVDRHFDAAQQALGEFSGAVARELRRRAARQGIRRRGA